MATRAFPAQGRARPSHVKCGPRFSEDMPSATRAPANSAEPRWAAGAAELSTGAEQRIETYEKGKMGGKKQREREAERGPVGDPTPQRGKVVAYTPANNTGQNSYPSKSCRQKRQENLDWRSVTTLVWTINIYVIATKTELDQDTCREDMESPKRKLITQTGKGICSSFQACNILWVKEENDRHQNSIKW